MGNTNRRETPRERKIKLFLFCCAVYFKLFVFALKFPFKLWRKSGVDTQHECCCKLNTELLQFLYKSSSIYFIKHFVNPGLEFWDVLPAEKRQYSSVRQRNFNTTCRMCFQHRFLDCGNGSSSWNGGLHLIIWFTGFSLFLDHYCWAVKHISKTHFIELTALLIPLSRHVLACRWIIKGTHNEEWDWFYLLAPFFRDNVSSLFQEWEYSSPVTQSGLGLSRIQLLSWLPYICIYSCCHCYYSLANCRVWSMSFIVESYCASVSSSWWLEWRQRFEPTACERAC